MRLPSEQLQAVEIEINHTCNRACSYCPNSISERKSKGLMRMPLFSKILQELFDFEFQGRLSFHFYSEPLLHPELSAFVQAAKMKLPKSPIHIYSNGTLLTTEKFLELDVAGVDLFIVTRQEADQKNDKYVFESVYKDLSTEQRAKVLYRSYRELHFVNRGGMLPHLGRATENFLPCYLPTHVLNITVDGRVLACLEDFEEEQIFGDLKSESLVEIWKRDNYQSFRKRLRTGLRHEYKPCNVCNRREALPPFF